MNPAHKAEDYLTFSLTQPSEDQGRAERDIARAQVYATLALANAIEGIGIDFKDALQTVSAELGAIAMSVAE